MCPHSSSSSTQTKNLSVKNVNLKNSWNFMLDIKKLSWKIMIILNFAKLLIFRQS